MDKKLIADIAQHLASVSGLIRHKGFLALLGKHESRFNHFFIGELQSKMVASLMRQLGHGLDVPLRELTTMGRSEVLACVADALAQSALALNGNLKKSAFTFKVPRKASFIEEAMALVKDSDQLRYDLAELNGNGNRITGMSAYATDFLYEIRSFVVASYVLRIDTNINFYERLLQYTLDKGRSYWLDSLYYRDVLVHDFDTCRSPNNRLVAIGLEQSYVSSCLATEGGLMGISDLKARGLDILVP